MTQATDAAAIASPEQIREYEEQLRGIEQLLKLTPDDESLQNLKKDILELLSLTRQQQSASASASDSSGSAQQEDGATEQRQETSRANTDAAAAAPESCPESADTKNAGNKYAATKPDNSKKRKKINKAILEEKWEIPEHLIPLDTDTEAERNKKRRAAKALKSKFRAKKKEAESAHKQKNWQSFLSKKKISNKKSSIFSTGDASASANKVGVISKQTLTDFTSRKRHKHA